MHDFWMLLKLDNISWRRTLQNFHNFMQWHVVNTFFQERKSHHNQNHGSKGNTQNWGRIGSCNQLLATVNMELRWELCISHGSNKFVMNLSNIVKEIQKFRSKNMRQNWMRRISHADQRIKQNHKEDNLRGSSPKTVHIEKRIWDRCWTKEIFILRLWSIEEIDASSSSLTTCA